MFFLSEGILENINNRGNLVGQSLSYIESKNDASKIRLRNHDNPAIVRVENISAFNQNSIVTLNLFDGKEDLEVRLSNENFVCLNSKIYFKYFGKEKQQNDIAV